MQAEFQCSYSLQLPLGNQQQILTVHFHVYSFAFPLGRVLVLLQRRYQLSADSQRLLAPEFKTGSQAFIKAQFFRTTRPSEKLSEKFLGPYEIIARPGSHSVTL